MTATMLRKLLPLLLLAAPLPVAAQTSARTLRPGDDVRVLAPSVRSSRIRGNVVLYQGSTLELREGETGRIVSIPVRDIHSLALNEGLDRGRSSWHMARFGAFLGGAGGLVSGPLIATSRAPGRFGEVMLASTVVGAVGGTAAGAILGALFARDHWQRFRMPIVTTTAGGGAAVGLAWSTPAP